MKLGNVLGKYTKDWFITLAVVILGLTAVLGPEASDYAKTKFWWKFWDTAALVSGIALFLGWLYLVAKDRQSREGQQ